VGSTPPEPAVEDRMPTAALDALKGDR